MLYPAGMERLTLASPLGPLTLSATAEALVSLRIGAGGGPDEVAEAGPLLRQAAAQLQDYFARRRRDFDLPLAPRGSDFERQVWQGLCEIPYGGVETYGQLARRVGGVARAVGQACGANPIPIVIPCHRVLSASGAGGFSAPGGVDTKYKLLTLEGAALL